MSLSDYVPILIAVIGAAVSVYGVWKGRKKIDAETAEKVSVAWETLNKPLLERVEKLERRDEILRQRERMLWDYVDQLRRLLKENAIEAPPLADLPKLE